MSALPMSLGALSCYRIQGILDEQLADAERNGPVFWNIMVPDKDAKDGEVFATKSTRNMMAEVILLDQRAPVHRRAKDNITVAKMDGIPKIKHGVLIDERMISLIDDLMERETRELIREFEDGMAGLMMELVKGVLDRRALLVLGMMRDDSDYNRFGVTWENFSWGVSGIYKPPTPAVAWNTAAATPITDIYGQIQAIQDDGGMVPDTMVLNQATRNAIVATTQFKEQASGIVGAFTPLASLPMYNTQFTTGLLGQMLGLRVIVMDDPMRMTPWKLQCREEKDDGGVDVVKFIEDGEVFLFNSRDFGNTMSWDGANLLVPETDPMFRNAIVGGGFARKQRGPVAFVTLPDSQLNPPNLTPWAVQRVFPRLHYKKNKTYWKVF